MLNHLKSFSSTKRACYIGYIVQAIVNNFITLLFVTFHQTMGITLEDLALVASFNFFVQLFVDFTAARYADRIAYRKLMVMGQLCAALGLIGYAFLPFLFTPLTGLMMASFLCAVGGGIVEVLVSPIIEACPSDQKSASMSILHSFYCWGQAGVILFSTLFFALTDIGSWRILTCLWALIPLANTIIFLQVPLNPVIEDGEAEPPKILFRNKKFWLLIFLMICAGASELAMAQWASAFAEAGLQVSKTIGDLTGPCLFALLTGIVRVIYSLMSRKIRLISFMMVSAIVCLTGYLLAAFAPHSAINLLGCALVGLSIAMFWPGTISLAARLCPTGGTFMFGILALAGDIGCVSGTAIVGYAAGLFGDNLKMGLAVAAVFPLLMLVGILASSQSTKNSSKHSFRNGPDIPRLL